MGRRVVAPFVAVVAIFLGSIALNIGLALNAQPRHSTITTRLLAGIAPVLGLVVAVPIFVVGRSKTAQFRIEDNALVLDRKRYPLGGLIDVQRDPHVMRWALKMWGNGGLGSIRGRFYSRRMGKFDAFLTDPDYAVVLRWPDRVVAVSPADPEFFMLMARKAGGIR